jgi:hypothetical protein
MKRSALDHVRANVARHKTRRAREGAIVARLHHLMASLEAEERAAAFDWPALPLEMRYHIVSFLDPVSAHLLAVCCHDPDMHGGARPCLDLAPCNVCDVSAAHLVGLHAPLVLAARWAHYVTLVSEIAMHTDVMTWPRRAFCTALGTAGHAMDTLVGAVLPPGIMDTGRLRHVSCWNHVMYGYLLGGHDTVFLTTLVRDVTWTLDDFEPRTQEGGYSHWYRLVRRILKHRPVEAGIALMAAVRATMPNHIPGVPWRAMMDWSVLARCAEKGPADWWHIYAQRVTPTPQFTYARDWPWLSRMVCLYYRDDEDRHACELLLLPACDDDLAIELGILYEDLHA